jgi:hypothetical protein
MGLWAFRISLTAETGRFDKAVKAPMLLLLEPDARMMEKTNTTRQRLLVNVAAEVR